MTDFILKDIKTKRPWGRIVPSDKSMFRTPTRLSTNPSYPKDEPLFRVLTQADFLREYYPSGHLINSESYYPDIYREEVVEVTDKYGNPVLDENGNPVHQTNHYIEHVPRWSFAFQQLIALKQTVHVVGNDTQFDILPGHKVSDDLFRNFRAGWLEKDMEIAIYELVRSVKIVGDGAIVCYMDNGKFGWQSLSYYQKYDTLYPHYRNGKLDLFARAFSDYDEEGQKAVNWLEVWDETYLYRYRQDLKGASGLMTKVKTVFGLSGYTLVSKKEHGFSRIPIIYFRDEDGPSWTHSQDTIDGYELDFSQMSQNNHAYGEPILYLQGDEVAATHDMNGSVKVLTMGQDDKAGYLQSQSAAESYQKELDKAFELIFLQSSTVLTPKISGNSDISGAALKVLYGDAHEKASHDCQEYTKVVNDLKDLFAEGYGMEVNKQIDFMNAPIYAWLKPYVLTNESSEVNDLVQAVSAGFCSKQTASERIPFYTDQDEWERIIKEQKQEQQADLLYQLKMQQQQPQQPNNPQ